MNFKRLISMFVAVLMILGSVAAVNAASFPDLEDRHSWAEDAISSMLSRGILKGYTDGTFKPDKSVSHIETLIIAARIMGIDEAENAEYREVATKQYSSSLNAYDIDYKDEISYLLYTGVLTTDELSSYISNSTKNSPLKRYEAAVLLTKLVGGEKEALKSNGNVSEFVDGKSIPSSARPYVEYVFNAGLMNGVGADKFSPEGELTRAMISTVMLRAEDYMDESCVEGVIKSKSGNVVSITIKDLVKEVTLPSDIIIRVDGKKVDLSSLSVGQQVRVHYQGDEVRFVDALTSNLYQTVSGTIYSVSESAGVKKITIKNAIDTYTYPIIQLGCEYYVNDKISTYADIKTNMYATFVIQGGEITKISVETGSKKYTGTLVSVNINETLVSITVELSNGTQETFVVGEDLTVTRNGSRADILSLANKDYVTVTLTQGEVEAISATSATGTKNGTISKIVISSNPEITIKTSTGENIYSVTNNTKFTVDGKENCSIYDLRLGASASIKTDSSNLVSISTQTMVATPTLTGVITYVHPTSYVMGVKIIDTATGEEKEVQTVASKDIKVTDTTSSRISSFKALQPGMAVVVIGTSNYGVYETNQIIVTAIVE